MSLVDQIGTRDWNHPFYTFEFFPPRTDQVFNHVLVFSFNIWSHRVQGFENLISRISRLSALQPLAISVTWGAGGSTKDRSLELASFIQNTGINTILHLTCTNMQTGLIDQVLKVHRLPLTMSSLFWLLTDLLLLVCHGPRNQEHIGIARRYALRQARVNNRIRMTHTWRSSTGWTIVDSIGSTFHSRHWSRLIYPLRSGIFVLVLYRRCRFSNLIM